MAPSFDRAPVAGVEAFDRGSWNTARADLHVVVQEGMNSSQALSHNRTIAGYRAPHFSASSVERLLAAVALTAV